MTPSRSAREETKHGAVESRAEATQLRRLLSRSTADEIDGIIVTLPNFGDERAIADTLRMAGLNVPVLVQATPDTPGRMTIADRRDSFCGKMSACNNLTQYGIPYSLTTLHTEAPDSDIVPQGSGLVRRGLPRGERAAAAAHRRDRRAAGGVQHGALQRENSGSQWNLGRDHRSFGNPRPHRAHERPRRGRAGEAGRNPRVRFHRSGIPADALLKMAKLGAVIDGWMTETNVAISAVQCWTSMEEYFGVVPCTVMSMMSENLMSSACEVDICGVVGMHALQLASRDAQRAARLEQQLRRRSRQGRLLPLQQSAQAFLREVRMDFQADHRRNGGKREHLRHVRGPGESRAR